eukprot:403348702
MASQQSQQLPDQQKQVLQYQKEQANIKHFLNENNGKIDQPLTYSEISQPKQKKYDYEQKIEHFVVQPGMERLYLRNDVRPITIESKQKYSQNQNTYKTSPGRENSQQQQMLMSGGDKPQSTKEGLLIRNQFKLPVLLQQTENLQSYLSQVEKIGSQLQQFEDFMVETRSFMRNTDYISVQEFQVRFATTLREIEMAVEHRMEMEFLKLKARVDEKAQKEDVDKILKQKTNITETTRKFEILEERIIQSNFDLHQFNDNYFREISLRLDKRDELVRDMQNSLVNKVEMKLMGEVLERVNKLESMMGIDDDLSTDRSIQFTDGENDGGNYSQKSEKIDLLTPNKQGQNNMISVDFLVGSPKKLTITDERKFFPQLQDQEKGVLESVIKKQEKDELTISNLKKEQQSTSPIKSKNLQHILSFKSQEQTSAIKEVQESSISKRQLSSIKKMTQKNKVDSAKSSTKQSKLTKEPKTTENNQQIKKQTTIVDSIQKAQQQITPNFKTQMPVPPEQRDKSNTSDISSFDFTPNTNQVQNQQKGHLQVDQDRSVKNGEGSNKNRPRGLSQNLSHQNTNFDNYTQDMKLNQQNSQTDKTNQGQDNAAFYQKKGSQASKSNEDGKQSSYSQTSPKFAGILKKQTLMLKKYFEERFKEVKGNMDDEKINGLQDQINKLEEKNKDIEGQLMQNFENVKHMRKNFDVLTVHKKYFDKLVQKPITYMEKLKAQILEQLSNLDSKFGQENKNKHSRYIELTNEAQRVRNKTELKLKNYDSILSDIDAERSDIQTVKNYLETIFKQNQEYKKELVQIKSYVMEAKLNQSILNGGQGLSENAQSLFTQNITNIINNKNDPNQGDVKTLKNQVDAFERELKNCQNQNRQILTDYMKLLEERKNIIRLNMPQLYNKQDSNIFSSHDQLSQTMNLHNQPNSRAQNPFYNSAQVSPNKLIEQNFQAMPNLHNQMNKLAMTSRQGSTNLNNTMTLQSTARQLKNLNHFSHDKAINEITLKQNQLRQQFNLPKESIKEQPHEAHLVKVPQINEIDKLKEQVSKRRLNNGSIISVVQSTKKDSFKNSKQSFYEFTNRSGDVKQSVVTPINTANKNTPFFPNKSSNTKLNQSQNLLPHITSPQKIQKAHKQSSSMQNIYIQLRVSQDQNQGKQTLKQQIQQRVTNHLIKQTTQRVKEQNSRTNLSNLGNKKRPEYSSLSSDSSLNSDSSVSNVDHKNKKDVKKAKNNGNGKQLDELRDSDTDSSHDIGIRYSIINEDSVSKSSGKSGLFYKKPKVTSKNVVPSSFTKPQKRSQSNISGSNFSSHSQAKEKQRDRK